MGLGYGVVVVAQRLQQLVTETLAEAVEDAEQQGEGNQADQDHTQPQLTNHQQVDPQGEGAVHGVVEERPERERPQSDTKKNQPYWEKCEAAAGEGGEAGRGG